MVFVLNLITFFAIGRWLVQFAAILISAVSCMPDLHFTDNNDGFITVNIIIIFQRLEAGTDLNKEIRLLIEEIIWTTN